jgi:hypothetical protein
VEIHSASYKPDAFTFGHLWRLGISVKPRIPE